MIDAIQTALDAGGDRLDPAVAQRAHDVVRRAGQRLRLGPDQTVVALAGATGSGKSSLFNALAGMEIAAVGARRPTTGLPAAAVWGDGAGDVLDWLEIPTRHRTSRESVLDAGRQAPLQGLVLLDLPDHDSTQVAHRLEVDRLVEVVDLMLWVVDPQKYADAALHERYLRRLAGREVSLAFVLNQADTLDPDSVAACRADLQRLLREDGLRDVEVLVTSARTGSGVAMLRSRLEAVVRGRRTALARATAEVRAIGAELAAQVAPDEPGVDDDRSAVASVLVSAMASAAGLPALLDAVEQDTRERALGAVGWPFTRWRRRLRADPMASLRAAVPSPAARARLTSALFEVAGHASAGLPRRWADAVQAAAQADHGDLDDELRVAVSGVDLGAGRRAWWRAAGGLQAALAAAAVVGLVWLIVLGLLGWLRVPEPPTPTIGEVPWPTALLLGGVVLGLALTWAGSWVATRAGRRRRRAVDHEVRAALHEVAMRTVLAPVRAVLEDHRACREALARFR